MQDIAFEKPTFTTHQYEPSQNNPPKKGSKLFLFILLLIIVGGLIYGGSKFLGLGKKTPVAPSPTPTPSEAIFPTDTPTPEVSKKPAVSNTPTPKPTVNPVDKTTGLDRSDLSVEVQNGSGVSGAASKLSDSLKGFGYHIVSVGNADKSDYEKVLVLVKESKKSYLSLLTKDLGTSYSVGSSSADLSASASADARVIVGKE